MIHLHVSSANAITIEGQQPFIAPGPGWGRGPPAPRPSPAPRPLRWAPGAHPAASQTGRRGRLSLDMWEAEQLSCPPSSGGAGGANRPHAPHPSTSIREAAGSRAAATRERRWASLLCERPLIRPRCLSPVTGRHCAGQHAPRKGRRAVIDQAPTVSLSLWTFKGAIWHPERAIDERQLTPLWPPPGGRWTGPRGGRWEAPSCALQDGPSWGRAVGHQFTSSFCTEKEAGTVAVFSDKLQPPGPQCCTPRIPALV